MDGQLRILMVCLGNVCRSPLAERLLRHRLEGLPGDVAAGTHVSSAGVRAMVGSPVQPDAAAELRRLGGDARDFTARQVTPVMVTEADLVLTATRSLRSRVLEDAPRALKRTFTLREFAALVDRDGDAAPPGHGPQDLVAAAAAWRGSVLLDDYDVPDPMGRPPEVHREVAQLIDTACTTIARVLGDVLPTPP